MLELKESITNFWNNFKSDFIDNREKKKIFFVTVITSLLVHFQLYSLIISGPDTIINSLYHEAVRRSGTWTFYFMVHTNAKRKCCFSIFCKPY